MASGASKRTVGKSVDAMRRLTGAELLALLTSLHQQISNSKCENWELQAAAFPGMPAKPTVRGLRIRSLRKTTTRVTAAAAEPQTSLTLHWPYHSLRSKSHGALQTIPVLDPKTWSSSFIGHAADTSIWLYSGIGKPAASILRTSQMPDASTPLGQDQH